MRLSTRVSVFVLVAAVVPLLLLAYAAGTIASKHLADAVTRSQVQLADSLAISVGRVMGDSTRVLQAQMANFHLASTPDNVRAAFVVATYRLYPEIAIATLIGPDGAEIVPPIYRSADETTWVEGHDAVDDARVRRFRDAKLPHPADGETLIGTPYPTDGASAAVVPMAFSSPYGDGLVLEVELSLESARRRMEAAAGTDRSILLLGTDGTVLAEAGAKGVVSPDRYKPFLDVPSANIRFDDVGVVASSSRVPQLGWVVVIAESASVIRVAQSALLAPTWYIGGVALAFALVAGSLLSRSITAPILQLRSAARSLGEGKLGERVPVDGADEIGQLAETFNKMSERLLASSVEIAQKNERIEAFNRDLQARVDERTAQLREAQAQLVQSGQLAAIAEMSAGLAHELNNPLAGMLGMVQLVKARRSGTTDETLLAAAEEQALRCKEIVANLLRYTDAPTASPSDEQAVLDLDVLVSDVLELVGPALRQRSVTTERKTSQDRLWVRANGAQLGRALSQILTAIRGLCTLGTTVAIEGRVSDGHAILSFVVGETTASHDDWRAAGLTFWAARQVLAAHGFTLREPEQGGRTWTIDAPLQEPPG